MNVRTKPHCGFRQRFIRCGLAVLVLGAAATELVGRVAIPGYLSEQALFEYEPLRYVPDRHYRLGTPEFHHDIVINGDGFRDTARLADLNHGDIVAIGDSVTFGTGVATDDTFVKLLQTMLRTSHAGVTVYNSGIGGQNPRMPINTYWQHLSDSNHSTVLLTHFARDDFVSEAPIDHFNVGVMPTKDIACYHWRVRSFLSENSIIYSIIRELIFMSKKLSRVLGKMGLINNWRIPLSYDWPLYPDNDGTLNYTCDLITRFKSDLAQRDRNLVILMLPTAMQVEISDPIPGTGYPQPGEEFDPMRQNRQLVSCLQAKGLNAFDISPLMRQSIQKGGTPLYWARDIHLNIAGHEFAARFLATLLGSLIAQHQPSSRERNFSD